MGEEIRTVRIDTIDVSARDWRPSNYRSHSGWQEFTRGIQDHGLRVRPELRPATDPAYAFEPVTALRAVLAAAECGLVEIECIILPACDDFDAAVLAFQRSLTDGDPKGIVLERGWAILRLQAELQKRQLPATGAAIAKATGLSESYVSECRTIAEALPRESFLRIAHQEGVPEFVAVSLARDCLKPLRKLDPARREKVLRSALREAAKRRGAATAVVRAATSDAGAVDTSVRVEADANGSLTICVGRKRLEFSRDQAGQLYAALKQRHAQTARWQSWYQRLTSLAMRIRTGWWVRTTRNFAGEVR